MLRCCWQFSEGALALANGQLTTKAHVHISYFDSVKTDHCI